MSKYNCFDCKHCEYSSNIRDGVMHTIVTTCTLKQLSIDTWKEAELLAADCDDYQYEGGDYCE